ncbi:Cell surface protein [Methanosarcina siciliae HI350]|uniref:Cell surface protein n=1 Tax=Methanosarcina siciliae HI350 TaxID=1434119 RepID=A0A0E3PI49_9EURY|nr:PQQ-binding-like beta-propeller repeat protein [Methanosarcina siciliae]AKB34213.1 Cell surface protein [Methanosarcina siciliae HI350]
MKCMKVLMVCLTLLLVVASQPVLGSDWPQFQKDKVHSGVTGDSASIADPNSTISWQYDHPVPSGGMSGIDESPVVYNGSVYAVIAGGSLTKYSLDGTAAGGNWPVSFVSNPDDLDFQLATPAAGNGHIFVVDTGYSRPLDYDLYAIDATTGSISGRVHVNNSTGIQFLTPVTYVEASNGSKYVLFGSGNMSDWTMHEGEYYCYNVTDPANMEMCWNYSSPAGYYWAGAAVIGDYAVFGDDASNLVSINYKTGATVNVIDASTVYGFDVGKIRSSVTYSDDGTAIFGNETGRVYFTSQGGYCYALGFNENNGSFITADNWSTPFVNNTTSTPAYYNGRIYVGNYTTNFSIPYYDGNLWCLNEDDGTEIWNVSVGPVQSSPAVSTFYGPGNEYIYITTNSPTGGIYCVDSDGTEVWNETSSGSNLFSLAGAAISGGWVFYGNDDGYLHGLANYTRYDFNGSTDMWAYKYQVDTNPPNTATDPAIEFSSAEYNAIRTDDDTIYASSQTTTDSYYAAHRFVFKIDDNEEPWIISNNGSINVTWNGKAYYSVGGTNGATLYIWNGTAYESLDDDANGVNEFSLIGGVTSNIGNYIDGSGNVTVLVVQKDEQSSTPPPAKVSHIKTDYVKLVATP